MAFERITDGDLLGKGNLGRPDTPGVDTAEMQRILDELPREVIVPAFNRLAEQLEAQSAAAGLGAAVPAGLPEDTPATVQGTLEAALNKSDAHAARTDNPHAVTAAQAGAYTREETDAAIGQRVVEIGAGDMARAVYDPAGEKRDVFAAIREGVAGAGHMEKSVYAAKGEAGAVDRALTADAALTAAAADDGVKVYTHSKSGTVHEFTGKGANGRALLTADVEAGDTFTVNGEPAEAYLGTEEAARAMAGSPWNGRWVSFVFDGETLNFKGGDGLTAADKAKLIPENIRAGVTLFDGTAKEVTGQLHSIEQEPQFAITMYYASQCWTPSQYKNTITEYVSYSVTADNNITIRIVKAFKGMAVVFNNVSTSIPANQIRTFEAGESYVMSQYTSQRGGTLAIWKLD